MNQKRQQILKWHQKGIIEDDKLNSALDVSNANNSPQDWFTFISSSFLWLSILSIAFGTIFFFAYNWNEISNMQKFALVQSLILASAFAYTQTKAQSTTSTALLFFLALLIGSLFALFGQTYQTGKDPWQLFMLWMLFSLPLALTSKSSSLWLLTLALANLTLHLYFNVRHGLFGMFLSERIFLFYAILNLGFVLILEYLFYRKNKLIKTRIAAQVALLACMAAFSFVSIYSIFESSSKQLDLLLYLGWMAGVYYFYRVKSTDVLVLSAWIVSGIIFVITFLARAVGNDLDSGLFLFMGIVIIGLSTAGVKWLLKLLKQQKSDEDNETGKQGEIA